MQVFPHRQDRLLFRLCQQPGDQGVVRLLPLPLRGQLHDRIVRRVRQGEQCRQQRGNLFQRQPRRPQRLFQRRELRLGSIRAVPVQDPLQMLDHREEGALLVIGGTTKYQACGALAEGVLTQHLHQARFANARLPTEQHHLAPAVLAVCPALQEQHDFGLAPHQGRQAARTSDVQAALRRTFPQHPIHLHRRRDPFEVMSPQLLSGKIPTYQAEGGRTDHDRIRRCQSLEAGRQIGRLPQRQLFLAAAAPDLAHDHQAGVDPHPYG